MLKIPNNGDKAPTKDKSMRYSKKYRVEICLHCDNNRNIHNKNIDRKRI